MKLIVSASEARQQCQTLKYVLLIVFCFVLMNFSWAQSEKQKAMETEADTLLNRQDYAGALKLYSRILKESKEKDKFFYSVLYKSAVSHYSIGQFDEALAELNDFIPAYPNFPQAHLLRAFTYREKGDVEHQLSELKDLMLLQPGSPDLLKWRAMLYLDQNKYDSAKIDLLQARQVQDDPEVETYLGFAYYNTDKPDSALMSLNKAMELDATYQPAYLYAGSFCLQDGNYDLAIKYLNLALRLDAKNATALFYKGVALVEKKKVDEGCKCLNKAFYLGADDAADYLKEYCFEIED